MTTKSILTAIFALFSGSAALSQQLGKDGKVTTKDPEVTEYYDPVPREVTPAGVPYGTPSDADVLFDGKDLSKWQSEKNKTAATWKVSLGVMTIVPESGNIATKESFGSFQLHIEWKINTDVKGKGQERGNSGIFFHGLYELQVLDSYHEETYVDGQAGSIYKQAIPLVNACRKPGEWQTYDVIFTAPVFYPDKSLMYPARVTVLQNGILVLNNFSIQGPTQYIGIPKYTYYDGRGPLVLQDHHNPSNYRNIWIRELGVASGVR